MSHITHPNRQQFIGAIGGIDPEREQAKITRLLAEIMFNALDRFEIPNRIDLDGSNAPKVPDVPCKLLIIFPQRESL